MAISFDFSSSVINLSGAESTSLLVQDLADAIREAEDSDEGIQYRKIAETSGKESLGGGVSIGITVSLNSPWQIMHEAGNYQATISGGNLVGGLAGNPIKYSPGVQVSMIQSASATIVTVVTGSGVTEQDKLDIVDGTRHAILGAVSYP